jgi:hypothetical protein
MDRAPMVTPALARSRPLLTFALALFLGACGQTIPPKRTSDVRITVPTPGSARAVIQTLEPPPSPSPSPSPSPTPGPTPLEPPRSASIVSSAGSQQGALSSSGCWLYGDGRNDCSSHPPAQQTAGLAVRKGETIRITIDAPAPPDEETVKAYQGTRSGPATPVQPGLTSSLQINLEPGRYDMDLCATWKGHGEAVCWLFRLEVSGS